MSIFGQEGIGRPDLEADGEVNAMKKYLLKSMEESELPTIQAVLIFMNPAVEIQVGEDAPLTALKIDQLKSFFRQKTKEKPITPAQLAAVKAALPE